MARFYGDTSDPADIERYEAAQAKLAADVLLCRYCKAAKTRGKRDRCTTHRNRGIDTFATSPVSEHYWAT